MLSTTQALLLGLFLGAMLGVITGVSAAKLEENTLGRWPITRATAQDLHRVRRVLRALANEVGTARPSPSGPDDPSPDTDVLHRILTASGATEEDLWQLSGALRDLASRERSRSGARSERGEDR